ncbi:MAG: hypothetical protein FJX74_16865 [Armatimonadetes bacterium]|nr:hypothetical protein [Armatimonadota bacterium]
MLWAGLAGNDAHSLTAGPLLVDPHDPRLETALMFWMVLCVLTGAGFGHIMRRAQLRQCGMAWVGAWNCLFAALAQAVLSGATLAAEPPSVNAGDYASLDEAIAALPPQGGTVSRPGQVGLEGEAAQRNTVTALNPQP